MGKVTKVTIEIETTNDAFEHPYFAQELNYVLIRVQAIDGKKLLDSNGNTVGTVKVETE